MPVTVNREWRRTLVAYTEQCNHQTGRGDLIRSIALDPSGRGSCSAMTDQMQHDDHCWLTAGGEAWAIRRIMRRPEGLRFYVWRGYAPHLEYATIDMPADWDMQRYAAKAASYLADAGHA